MNIVMLYDVFRWEEKSILEAARTRGIPLKPVHVASQSFPIEKHHNTREGDIALLRVTSQNRAMAIASLYELYGYHIVNSGESTRIMMDKLWTHTLLESNNIPTPKTRITFTIDEALNAGEEIGYPLVVKPIQGSWGRLVALARDRDSLRSLLEYAYYMGPQYRVFYLQEYIEKPGRDIRTFCLGDSVIAGIYRVSQNWITNTARGGRAVPVPTNLLEDDLGKLTLATCRAVGAEFAGVDLVEDPERGLLVLEVNAVPEFKNTVRVTGTDIPGLLVEYLVSLAGGKPGLLETIEAR